MNRAERRGGLNCSRLLRGGRLIAVAVSAAVALATGLLVATPARAAVPAPDAVYTVGDYPVSIAVNPAGTIAVTVNAGVSTASVIDLGTGDDSTVTLATQPDWRPRDVAIDPAGTYAYVTNYDSNSISRINLLDLTMTLVPVGGGPTRIVIDPAGVYAYVTVGAVADRIKLSDLTVDSGFLNPVPGPLVITADSSTIYSYYQTAKRFDAATGTVTATFTTGAGGVTGAGFNADQTAIYGVNDSGWVRKTDLTTLTTEVWASGLAGFNSSSWVSVGNNAYVPAINDHTLYKVDLLLPETVTTVASHLSNPMDVAVPVNGAFIVIASAGSDNAFRYNLPAPPTAPAFTAASPPSTGTVGTTYSTYSFTASGTSPITFAQASGTLPPGLTLASTGVLSGTPTTAGTYTFTVSASNGVNPVATTSTITITIAPAVTPEPNPPAPSVPASAPREVRATPGIESATVSWTPPASTGSFPVTSYLAVAAPGGQLCMVSAPALTCAITGLTPGTSYKVTARALTGAGWSDTSSPSADVVPLAPPAAPTILITSSRDRTQKSVARIEGTTTGLVGAEVVPYIRVAGKTSFSPGASTRTVDADGKFTWQRKAKKRLTVYFVSGGVTSNRLVIRPE